MESNYVWDISNVPLCITNLESVRIDSTLEGYNGKIDLINLSGDDLRIIREGVYLYYNLKEELDGIKRAICERNMLNGRDVGRKDYDETKIR